eukprot:ANDGO_06247.mRNA.1 hypothetical protein
MFDLRRVDAYITLQGADSATLWSFSADHQDWTFNSLTLPDSAIAFRYATCVYVCEIDAFVALCLLEVVHGRLCVYGLDCSRRCFSDPLCSSFALSSSSPRFQCVPCASGFLILDDFCSVHFVDSRGHLHALSLFPEFSHVHGMLAVSGEQWAYVSGFSNNEPKLLRIEVSPCVGLLAKVPCMEINVRNQERSDPASPRHIRLPVGLHAPNLLMLDDSPALSYVDAATGKTVGNSVDLTSFGFSDMSMLTIIQLVQNSVWCFGLVCRASRKALVIEVQTLSVLSTLENVQALLLNSRQDLFAIEAGQVVGRIQIPLVYFPKSVNPSVRSLSIFSSQLRQQRLAEDATVSLKRAIMNRWVQCIDECKSTSKRNSFVFEDLLPVVVEHEHAPLQQAAQPGVRADHVLKIESCRGWVRSSNPGKTIIVSFSLGSQIPPEILKSVDVTIHTLFPCGRQETCIHPTGHVVCCWTDGSAVEDVQVQLLVSSHTNSFRAVREVIALETTVALPSLLPWFCPVSLRLNSVDAVELLMKTLKSADSRFSIRSVNRSSKQVEAVVEATSFPMLCQALGALAAATSGGRLGTMIVSDQTLQRN